VIYITHVHMSTGGTEHEHIQEVKWRNPDSGATGQTSRQGMVEFIRDKSGIAKVRDRAGHVVRVGVVKATVPYIRTFADKVWTDNLLSLPRY
jgi:hypothetical protein